MWHKHELSTRRATLQTPGAGVVRTFGPPQAQQQLRSGSDHNVAQGTALPSSPLHHSRSDAADASQAVQAVRNATATTIIPATQHILAQQGIAATAEAANAAAALSPLPSMQHLLDALEKNASLRESVRPRSPLLLLIRS